MSPAGVSTIIQADGSKVKSNSMNQSAGPGVLLPVRLAFTQASILNP